jgi:CDP-diacylglycerol--serine O-phosphatidyltransferase
MLVGVYNPPTLVTLCGLACGTGACLLALAGLPELAVVAMIWAGIFDLFDGMVARRTRMSPQESAFGIQIDSIVDMVSFGIVPVLVARSLGMSGVVAVIVSILYVCAAAQRLAYFNVLQTEAEGGLKTYTGLPVTFAALIFGVCFATRGWLSPENYSHFLTALVALVAFLFVYPAKIPKPKGAVYVVMPLLAIGFTVFWLMAHWQR